MILNCDEPLSNVAFKINLRRYRKGGGGWETPIGPVMEQTKRKLDGDADAADDTAAADDYDVDGLEDESESLFEVVRCRLTLLSNPR